VVDALLKRPVPSLGEHSVQDCDPVRPATYVRGVGNRRRWEIALLPSEDATAMAAPEKVWRLLERWITPEDAELERRILHVSFGYRRQVAVWPALDCGRFRAPDPALPRSGHVRGRS